MSKKVRKVLFVLFSCLMTSCSTSEEFVVVNRSNGAVKVDYALKECTETVQFPAKLSLSEFEQNQDWRFLDEADSNFATQTCSFKVELEKDEVLLLQNTYQGERDRNERLRLKSISLTGKQGKIVLEGKLVEANFVNESGKYTLTYK